MWQRKEITFIFCAAIEIIFLQYSVYGLLFGPPITADPDIYRNVSQLITSKGYPLEEYEVVTSDGYILSVHRIPFGLNNRNAPRPRKVAYLQHGIMAASDNFVLNSPDQSLAFILADAGYDVWLGDSRGSPYSKKHLVYTSSQSKFWAFTFDDIAVHDLPATLDFVLKKTNQSSLHYIAHSQGTTILFAMLSLYPKYNEKIKVGICLAPVAYESHVQGLLRVAAPFNDGLKLSTDVLGDYEFFPNSTVLNLATGVCGSVITEICKSGMFFIGGPDSGELNSTRMPVFLAHLPVSTSARNLVHHGQLISSGKFQRYDYGVIGNLQNYGQLSPPLYDWTKVTAPIALIYGQTDWIGNPTDVATAATKIQNLAANYRVPKLLWNHFDFLLASAANIYVFPEVMRIMKKYP